MREETVAFIAYLAMLLIGFWIVCMFITIQPH